MPVRLGTHVLKSRPFVPITATSPQNKTYSANGTYLGSYGGVTVTLHSKDEWINYTNSLDGSRHRSNFCRHMISDQSYQGSVNTPSTVRWADTNYDEYYSHHKAGMDWLVPAGNTLMSQAGFGYTGVGSPFGANGQSLINEAAFKSRPDLTTMSMPNFLLEIMQFKLLFKLWRSNVGIAKNVAGAHLNYSYGWVPTIGDARSILNVVRSTLARIQEFEKSTGKIFSSTVTLLDTSYTSKGTGLVASHVGQEWHGTIRRVVRGHLRWKAMPLKALAPVPKALRAYLDALGFQLNARIIWDAIPLSFVIDGFIGLGDWLDQFQFDSLELPISYVDSCLTYKETLKVENIGLVHGAPYCSDATTPPARSAAAVWSRTFFERLPILPDETGFNLSGWKSPKLGVWLKYISLATVMSSR